MKKKETPERPHFPFYRSFYDSINKLPEEMQLPLYKAICDYALNHVEPTFPSEGQFSFVLPSVWESIKPNLANSYKNWQNGCNGGAPKENQNARKDKGQQPEGQPKPAPQGQRKSKDAESRTEIPHQGQEDQDIPF